MTYESRCMVCQTRFDWHASRFDSPEPGCPRCGGECVRLISAPAVIWSKPISDYGDPKKETYQKDQKAGGHWTYERNSDAARSAGKPLPVFVSSVQDQRDYCRREGLLNPTDLPSNLTVAADGKGYEKVNISEV